MLKSHIQRHGPGIQCGCSRGAVLEIDNLSLGWGLLARMNKGTKAILQRRKINDNVWLSVEPRFTCSGRLLLVKSMNFDFMGQYSDFPKFTAETQKQFRKDH